VIHDRQRDGSPAQLRRMRGPLVISPHRNSPVSGASTRATQALPIAERPCNRSRRVSFSVLVSMPERLFKRFRKMRFVP
jgi:hypothetical protein